MKHQIEPCKFLDWDSDFFGIRIAKVTEHRLSPSVLESIWDWNRTNNIHCLYYLADSDDAQSIRLAEENGFRNVEIRITYELSLEGWDPETRQVRNPDVHLRIATDEDVPALVELSTDSYRDSRWYFDPQFPQDKVRSYYPVWIENSVKGFADFVLVAELEGQVLGYISGNRAKNDQPGTLELMSVHPQARRHGIGHEVFSGGLDWHKRSGARMLVTNTQGRNITTNRLMIRLGLILKDIQIYYHKWFSNQGA